MKKRSLLLFLAAAIICSSCSKSEDSSEETAAEKTAEPRTELTLNPAQDNETPQSSKESVNLEENGNESPSRPAEEDETDAAAASKIKIEILPISNLEKLARRSISIPIIPEDMEIGILNGSTREGTVDYPDIIGTISSFFDGLSEGRVDEEAFSADSREYLSRITVSIMEKEIYPTSYRLGQPLMDEKGCSRINIRLFGDPGRTSGEVLLCSEDGRWLITDMQIDFSNLAIEYVKDYENYEPKVYRWLDLY